MESEKVLSIMVKVSEFLLKCDKKAIEHYTTFEKRTSIRDNILIVSFGEYDITFIEDEGKDTYAIYLHGYYKKYHTIMSERLSDKYHILWYSDKKFNYYAIKGENKINVQLNGMYKNTDFTLYGEDGHKTPINDLHDLKRLSKKVDKELCEELLLMK